MRCHVMSAHSAVQPHYATPVLGQLTTTLTMAIAVSVRRGALRSVRVMSSAATTATTEAPVLFSRTGDVVQITLNRPRALNALDVPMIRLLAPVVEGWRGRGPAAAAAPRAVVMIGAGDKAFCAGGDVRSLYDGRGAPGGAGAASQEAFFREEYTLDHALATMSPRLVAVYNGITMGGGVGLSINAPHRIATERAMFAMPETGIGLFPDVGGSHFLPRLPGEVGMYLALTGARIKGRDLVAAGIATAYMPAASMPALLAALSDRGGRGTDDVIAGAVAAAAAAAGEHTSAHETVKHRRVIDACFSATSVMGVLSRLDAVGDGGGDAAFARATAATLRRMSPTSLRVRAAPPLVGVDACCMIVCVRVCLCVLLLCSCAPFTRVVAARAADHVRAAATRAKHVPEGVLRNGAPDGRAVHARARLLRGYQSRAS